MTVDEIINKANSYVHNDKYVYWYGGKDQLCTTNLLNCFSQLYPNIYTPSYIAACKIDIKRHRKCIDCSGLVCAAYNKPMVGTSQFYKQFIEWKKTPENGVILWRKNHCGIYYNGCVIEARGRFKGITNTRPYIRSEWTRFYRDKNVTYSNKKIETKTDDYKEIAKEVIAGKWGNGQERKKRLTMAGYDYTLIQKLVNSSMTSLK